MATYCKFMSELLKDSYFSLAAISGTIFKGKKYILIFKKKKLQFKN